MRLIDADTIDFGEIFIGASDFAKDIRESAQSVIDNCQTAFDLESVIEQIKENLKRIREEQSADCKKHDGYWTPEQGMRGGMIKSHFEILEILKSAANATNGKNGG